MRNQRIRAPTDAEANGSAPKGRLRSLPLSSAPAEKGFAQCCQTRNAKAQKTVSPYRERRHFHFIAICSFCTLQRPLEHNIGSGSKATNVKREKKRKTGEERNDTEKQVSASTVLRPSLSKESPESRSRDSFCRAIGSRSRAD